MIWQKRGFSLGGFVAGVVTFVSHSPDGADLQQVPVTASCQSNSAVTARHRPLQSSTTLTAACLHRSMEFISLIPLIHWRWKTGTKSGSKQTYCPRNSPRGRVKISSATPKTDPTDLWLLNQRWSCSIGDANSMCSQERIVAKRRIV